jgi:hypothetical protein
MESEKRSLSARCADQELAVRLDYLRQRVRLQARKFVHYHILGRSHA